MDPTPRSSGRSLPARLAILTVTGHLAMAGALWAQFPSGNEFRVNTYTTGTQRFRSIATGPKARAQARPSRSTRQLPPVRSLNV